MVMIHCAILVAVIALVANSLPRLAHAQAEMGFKTPSNNIFCIIEPPYENHPDSDLRCDLQQMSSKPPPRPGNCPLSWGDAFSIGQNANMSVLVCHGDTTRNDELGVLAYGSEWKQGGFLCNSEATGLTCVNAKGHGFALSRAVQRVF
jgi:uncharacterized protein DUF6636